MANSTTTASKDGYSRFEQGIELVTISGYFIAVACVFFLVRSYVVISPLSFVFAVLLGLLFADFGTGFVHWFGDTWGKSSWPIVGRAFIRPFREHHVDEKAITRHGFVETNGTISFLTLPVALIALYFARSGSNKSFVAIFLASATIFGFWTNQFHKWAHSLRAPWYARILQRSGLILNPKHHRLHHKQPFVDNYSITNGWTNYITGPVRFYRFLEWCACKVLRAQPRAEA